MKKKILLIATGDTIFITNYVKALKKVLDVEVHVYSPHPRIGNYSSYPYDYVYFECPFLFKSRLLKKISFLLEPFIFRRKLSVFLKKQNTIYDIIHIHRILPAWVLKVNEYKKYCKKLFLTFWGGEIDVEALLMSTKIYKIKLDKLLMECDVVQNGFTDKRYFLHYPILKNKGVIGHYGSSIINEMSNICLSRENAKEKLGISPKSVTVMIGYSGKAIHNHCAIIRRIIEDENFATYAENIHIIISMTRGGSKEYANKIELELNKGGLKYTIINNGYSTDEDVACLRLATDFMFQLSDFDGLSSSIKECLCAGSIVITGSWLPYRVLKEKGFLYPEVDSIDMGVEKFYDLLKEYPMCMEEYLKNKELGRDEYSWDSCIKNWANEYKKVL